MKDSPSYYHDFIQKNAGRLIVQPRMGFSDLRQMRTGLEAVEAVDAASIGTITLDSLPAPETMLLRQNPSDPGIISMDIPSYPTGKK